MVLNTDIAIHVDNFDSSLNKKIPPLETKKHFALYDRMVFFCDNWTVGGVNYNAGEVLPVPCIFLL